MKISIDAERCTGHGLCYLNSPNLFEPDEEGYVSARGTTFDVPPSLENAAIKGARSCPERAISINSEAARLGADS